MKDLLKFVGLCIIIAMQSCTSDLEPTVPDNSEPEVTITHMVAKYGDKVYETDVKTVGDSVEYLNEEYAELYRTTISKMPDMSVMIDKDESGIYYVEFFDSEKELNKKYHMVNFENESNIDTRSTNVIDLTLPTGNRVLARAELYDDKNFKDTILVAYAGNFSATGVASLSDLGFNDKTSSIKVFNCMNASESYTLTYYDINDYKGGYPSQKQITHGGTGWRPVFRGWHNSNFSGVAINCVAPRTGSADNHWDYNLKNIGFNDKISSISWVMVDNFSDISEDGPLASHPDC